jgi:5-formyltetrahydrofolate cyclo-ligase
VTAEPADTAGVAARRARVLARRRRLVPAVVEHASTSVAGRVALLLDDLAPGRVASYFSTDGEIDPSPATSMLRDRGWSVWFPVVPAGPPAAMGFRRWDAPEAPPAGRFGLPAPPDGADEVAASDLDVVLVPLVVFGPGGVRAGRGSGYYDRTFEWRHTPVDPHPHGPLLVGLAHDFQEDGGLVARTWDVAVDVTVTPTRTLRW